MGKVYYNPESEENFGEEQIIGGSPRGIYNMTKAKHTWVKSIWKLQLANNWFTTECNLAADKPLYQKLPPERKYAYDMALGQVIANDSIQAPQLVNSIVNVITSKPVEMCLIRQSFEEVQHADTYTTMAEEICEDVDRIYSLDKYEPSLLRKNLAVRNMYSNINDIVDTDNVNPQDTLVATAANQILEEQVFPGSFLVLWSFNFPGTITAIGFIERDESSTHVPLFKNIFRTIVNEKEAPTVETLNVIKKMISDMADEEKLWLRHITKNLLGFSNQAIDMFVENKANSVCNNLNIDYLYTKTDGGPLEKMYRKYSKVVREDSPTIETKANFFEKKVIDYAKGVMDEDY